MKTDICLLDKITFLYLAIPLFVFFLFWLNIYMAIICISALSIILINIKRKNNAKFDISKDNIYITAAVSIFWCYCAGIGCYFWQSFPDWSSRNAMLNDLCFNNWPVVYNPETALVYYFGFCLVPCGIAKLFSGGIFSTEITTEIMNFACLCWSALGVSLCFLQLFISTKSKNKNFIITILIFILFSGLNLFIGNKPHFDWHPSFSYLCNTYQLFFSFHIIIPMWLTTFLMFNNRKNIELYGLITLFYVFYCPQALFACAIIYSCYLLKDFIFALKDKNISVFCKSIFNIKNLLAAFIIFPVIYLFFNSNYSASHSHFFLNKPCLLAFQCIFWGALVYLLLISKKYYKTILYFCILTILVVFPFIAYKTSYDFMIRSTIPATVIMVILIIRFLYNKKFKPLKNLLLICLLIGSISSLELFFNSYYFWNHSSKENYIKNDYKTFCDKIPLDDIDTNEDFDFRNYASVYYKNYPFWKYLSKHNHNY